jgi:hypothetical protein
LLVFAAPDSAFSRLRVSPVISTSIFLATVRLLDLLVNQGQLRHRQVSEVDGHA